MASRRNEPQGGELRDPRDLLDELEHNIEQLKGLYEQYFRGIEKLPPLRMLEAVERSFRNLQRGYQLRTVERFRMQGLQARLVTYKHYWKRILTQMEDGTYRRDVNRAARRQAAIEEAAARTAARHEDAGVAPGDPAQEGADAGSERRARPQSSGGTSLPDGITAGEVRSLFKDLVAAKRAAGESVAGLTYGSLVKKLAQTVPAIRDRHGCDAVRFEVSTTGGKVRLKARPATG